MYRTTSLNALIFNMTDWSPRYLKLCLENKHCTATVASKAETFINSLREHSFELLFIICDKNCARVDELLMQRHEHFHISCGFKPTHIESSFAFDVELEPTLLNDEGSLERLIKTLAALARKLKLQSELSSLLLHDMRSPTQSLISYMELLQQEVFGELNEGQKRILNNAMNLGDNLIKLLESLSLTFQFEQKQFQLHLKPEPPRQLINRTLKMVWSQADKKNIKLVPNIPSELPDISVDVGSMERVIVNILSNAINYTPERGTIHVIVHPIKHGNQRRFLQFRVSDSGPGIPNHLINDIFQRYFRLQDTAHLQKGQGLGLYIARLILEAHGGHIGAYNNREGGSTFYFDLPLA